MDHFLLRYFKYDHLPEKLQLIAKPFAELARSLHEILPVNFEMDQYEQALRFLLQAKDCAVRAALVPA